MSDEETLKGDAAGSPPPAKSPSPFPDPPSENVVESELDAEQEAFLAECEKEFSGRYTDADKEFSQFKNAPKTDPPCVHPWRVRPRRDFQHGGNYRNDDRGRNNYQNERSRDNRNHHRDDNRSRQDYNRDRSRHDDRNDRDRRRY